MSYKYTKTTAQYIQNLKTAPLSIKWKSFSKWQKEENVTNLYEACEKYHITITEYKNIEITLKLATKNETHKIIIPKYDYCRFEQAIVGLIKAYLSYLGDKTIMKTGSETTKINFFA